ncbi:hypothetical protein O6H91_22G002500 [Diphasiastrum complanatum]|uniref:Uncharacterized protein n=1 Tax=Diphasiastrum complanatum TaxID=34168 RepID=A0ACC2ACB8_DIPCM|nr:hypothetical protein O6H91_22G002500 [Diphasiastrum complanatum]
MFPSEGKKKFLVTRLDTCSQNSTEYLLQSPLHAPLSTGDICSQNSTLSKLSTRPHDLFHASQPDFDRVSTGVSTESQPDLNRISTEYPLESQPDFESQPSISGES